jgi:hypothetical protein
MTNLLLLMFVLTWFLSYFDGQTSGAKLPNMICAQLSLQFHNLNMIQVDRENDSSCPIGRHISSFDSMLSI